MQLRQLHYDIVPRLGPGKARVAQEVQIFKVVKAAQICQGWQSLGGNEVHGQVQLLERFAAL